MFLWTIWRGPFLQLYVRWWNCYLVFGIEKGGLFLNVALFMGPQYSEQNKSIANNEKAFMW